MTPTPSPLPQINVVLQQASPDFWQQLQSPTLLAAIIAGLIALAALIQKRRADNRSEWWRRVQWALDMSFSDNEDRKSMALAALDMLSDSKLAGPEELLLLHEVSERTFTVTPDTVDTLADLGDNEVEGEEAE